MNIGIPVERRPFEYRVGLSPAGVRMLTNLGHVCYVEHNAGLGAGFTDQEYEQAGARIVYSTHEVFGRADLTLKFARPLLDELEWMRPGTAFAGILHLGSARKDKIDLMVSKQLTAIAYEQIQMPDGSVPVRKPLSQIGGHMAAQIAARLLQNDYGGKGIFLGGSPGVPPAEVVIIGAGFAGSCATKAFLGMGAHVTVLDSDLNALNQIFRTYPGIVTYLSTPSNIEKVCAYADVVVGAVYVPGSPPPKVVTREMVKSMKPRSIIIDISIDEGGCVETSRPTTHEKPTYIEEGVIHYCVPNIPSVVARTSTHAFLNAAYPFIVEIVTKGVDAAIEDNPAIQRGTAVHRGKLMNISRLTAKESE